MKRPRRTSEAILEEELMPLQQALFRVTGQRRSTRTLLRWRISGIRGVRLECVKVGQDVLTSEPAIRRFLARINVLEPADAGRGGEIRARSRATSAVLDGYGLNS